MSYWKDRCRTSFLGLVFLLSFFLFIPVYVHAQASEQDILDAILGVGTFSDTELQEMDLNGDGVVDVGDMVHFTQPVAYFDTNTIAVSESDGLVNIPVSFSRNYDGVLTFELGGTATEGEDYAEITEEITVVDDDTAVISVSLIQDSDLEGTETLLLTLHGGADGQGAILIGIPSVVTIDISDGDSDTYTGGMVFDPEFRVSTQAIGFYMDGGLAHFQGDDSGIFPAAFSMPATITGGGTGISFPTPAGGEFESDGLGERTIGWTLGITNAVLDSGIMTAVFSLSFDSGLTASSTGMTMTGTMTLARITSE